MNRNSTKSTLVTLATFSMMTLVLGPAPVTAQVIQLPTVRIFNVRTVVSVPDAGRISLGGVNRNSSGSIKRGVPGVAGLPLAGRLFGNRAIGRNSGTGRTSVSAKIIIMKEYEAAVLAEAEKRRRLAALTDPNGSEKVQQQADFITRNIGRSRKR